MGMRNQSLASDPEPESTTALHDRALVESVRGGDRGSFAAIMRRYNQRLFRVARSIVGNDSEAEDVVQHAYVCAYAHLEQFSGAAAFSTWLTRIAINEALARVKNHSRTQSIAGDVLTPDWRSGTSVFPSPEDDLSRRQLARLLEAAIDELPEICRVPLILREVQGLSTAETAACLAISEEAVRTRLHRARALLRHGLAERIGSAALDVWSFAGERCRRISVEVPAALEALPTNTSRTAIRFAGARG
jgi:RNA polymerase sigma-70 factor, ECF subfamily